MECGEECVMVAGVTIMRDLCADNWDMMLTQVGKNHDVARI